MIAAEPAGTSSADLSERSEKNARDELAATVLPNEETSHADAHAVVHDDPDFLDRIEAALSGAGDEIRTYSTALAAYKRLG